MENKKVSEVVWSRFHMVKIVGLVVLILLVVGLPIFTYFRIKSEAHIALREAKNVKMTMQTLDIEYYALNSSIYDSSAPSGLKSSAEDEIWKLLEHDGEVVLQSYNQKKRTVLAFTYTNDHYQVTYSYDKDKGDCWQVRYFINVIDSGNE